MVAVAVALVEVVVAEKAVVAVVEKAELAELAVPAAIEPAALVSSFLAINFPV